MDFPLFTAVFLLCVFGLIMVFSASYYYAYDKFDDGLYFLKDQAVYMSAGIVAMLVISRIDYHRWDKLRVFALVLTLTLMAAVVIWGKEANGAKRWLSVFGLFMFQPSELAKFALILYMSSFMAKRPQHMKSFVNGVVPMLIIMALICMFLLLQRNLSMLIILMLTGMLMLFLGGAEIKHLLLMGAVAMPVFFLLAYAEEYRWARMLMFRDPFTSELDGAYQLRQSLYALGSGGLFGKGLNFSRQKLLFLPYGESDMIFSIIGEELGFIGCVMLISAYVFIVYRGIRIAIKCKDRFGSLMAAGITCVVGIQAAVNIGVATSSIPPTGQTLPFISAGGTSLLVFLGAMGILLNISRNIDIE
ncbi:MAG: putative lipid II flippase FtsW [Clostridia bacterium]